MFFHEIMQLGARTVVPNNVGIFGVRIEDVQYSIVLAGLHQSAHKLREHGAQTILNAIVWRIRLAKSMQVV